MIKCVGVMDVVVFMFFGIGVFIIYKYYIKIIHIIIDIVYIYYL